MPFEIPIHVRVSGRIDVHAHVHVDEGEGGEAGLIGQIGPFSEQEIPQMSNQAIQMTDSQKCTVGPFKAVDKRGKVIGDATGTAASTGDATLLTSVDNGDGTHTFLAQDVTPAGGTVQGVVTDANGGTIAYDFTLVTGSEAGLSGPVGAPEEQ